MVRKWSDADTHKKTALQYSYTSIKIITMYFLKKSGFTLIEMIIVLSVIGILVTAFAPQVTQYLEKSKVTQYQSFAWEMIKTITSYRAELGEITRPVPAWWDWFCVSENIETWCDTTWRHEWLSDYITKNNPKLHRTIKTVFPHGPNPDWEVLWYENLNLVQFAWWGYVFPGRDMTSTKTIWTWTWSVPYAPGLADGDSYYLDWTKTSLGKEFDKLCSPWLALESYRNDSWSVPRSTTCMYFFE